MAEKEFAGVTGIISAPVARAQFGRILNSVSKNQDRLLVSRRGEATVVILSLEDYLRNIVRQPDSLSQLQEAAARAGVDGLTAQEIEAEISMHRKGL